LNERNERLARQVDGPEFPVTRSGGSEGFLQSEPQLDAGITPGLATTTAAAKPLAQSVRKVTKSEIRIKRPETSEEE